MEQAMTRKDTTQPGHPCMPTCVHGVRFCSLDCCPRLMQERAELEAWREQVRAKYEEVGYGAQIPNDLPRQLQVGQRVTARHPVTRQIHDGDILTTAPKYYR